MDDRRCGLELGESVGEDLAEAGVVRTVAQQQDPGDGRLGVFSVAGLEDASVEMLPVGVRARVHAERIAACVPVDEMVGGGFVGLVGALEIGKENF